MTLCTSKFTLRIDLILNILKTGKKHKETKQKIEGTQGHFER
jgi:hypothetical protein